MSGKSIIFDDKMINKSNFYKSEKLKINDIYANKILVSEKEPYEHFIGYNDNNDIRPLCIKLLQMIHFSKDLDCYKTMSFKLGDKKLLKCIPKYGEKIAV